MAWYHGTSREAYAAIMRNGFDALMSKNNNRYGNGVYFSDKNDVDYYGAHVISADVKGRIMKMSIMEWHYHENRLIRKHGNDYIKFIPGFVKDSGADALLIEYASGSELVVYNTKTITITNTEASNHEKEGKNTRISA